jgi:ABC-2 type transport system ATP-binding protein
MIPLDVRGLEVALNGVHILDDVNLRVSENECVGLLGPNGSGKSTTLHAITGIVPGSAGRVEISGWDSASREAKASFGLVPDDLPMPTSLTGREFIALHRRLRGVDFDVGLAGELADLLDLTAHLGRPCGEYSHGMRRKLSLVVATAHRPRLLILDEPMRGLDPVAGMVLRHLIATWSREGTAVLLATHDLESAARMCDRVYILSSGSVVAHGAPGDITASTRTADLESAFMRLTRLEEVVAEKLEHTRRLLARNLESARP